MADALATLVVMFQINANDEVQLIRMSIKEEPTHCSQIKEEVDGKPWYYDILQFVKGRRYPYHVSENDKRILRRLAMGFLLDREVLYKKGSDSTEMCQFLRSKQKRRRDSRRSLWNSC